MKKAKLFTILLLVLGLFCSIFTLASCTKKTHTHSYANDWSQDELFHWQKCLGCETIRNKAEHDWNLGIVTLEPTEISEGIKTYTCNTCGQTQIESIPKIGAHEHTFSESWSSDDTYHWHASTCEHTNEISSKETHHWDAGVVTKQPTETTEGEKTYTCDVCLKTKVASIGTLGHVHTFDTEYSFDDNYHWYATTCGHSGEVKGKEPHKWDAGVVLSEATVYDEGVKLYTCQDCGQTEEETIEKLSSFTVIFYNSNNKVISNINYDLNTASSQIVVPAIQAEEGFQFEDWINIYDLKSVAEIDFSKAQKNVVYQFKPTFVKIHEVAFIDYEGNQLGEIFIVKDGEKILESQLPTIPTRTGYASQWDEQILSTKITEDKEFVPIYEIITYTVSFLDAKDGNSIATSTVEYGSFAMIPEYDLYRFGTKLYGFTGWKSSTTDSFIENVNGNKLTNVYSDITVYAVYEESIKQPVLAVHIDGTIVTMSLCMPDGTSLYSINMSMSWATEIGVSTINSVTIANPTYLEGQYCSSQNASVHMEQSDWFAFNNKTQTIDFVWGCGNGHSFTVDLNTITINFGVQGFAEINEKSFSIHEGSSIVYGKNGAYINDLKKSNITVWFY